MSASLVGSEMCIRDRLCPSRIQSSRQLLLDIAPSGAALSGTMLKSTLPVSYTHLTLPTICSV
eukprot:1485315-Alexandrium_andersonii.AAC.1